MPFVGYVAVIGVMSLAAGGVAPDSVESSTPVWLGYGWSGCMAVGGFAAVTGGVSGRTRLEAGGLALLIASLALFAWAGLLTGDLAADDAIALVALVGSFVLRIRQAAREREAVRIAHALAQGGLFRAYD